MATQFLAQLPRVSKADQPKDNQCTICMVPYETTSSDNETPEFAVLLPCRHLIGSVCVATWLSPEKGRNNTCPYCRRQLFELPARVPTRYAEIMEELETDAIPRALRPLGPLDEGAVAPLMQMSAADIYRYSDISTAGPYQWEAIVDVLRMHGDAHLEARFHDWRNAWIAAATEQTLDSLARARAAVLRRGQRVREFNIPWFEESEAEMQPHDVEQLERDIVLTASALRTLKYREVFLYLQMQPRRTARLPREMRERIRQLNYRPAEEYINKLEEGSYKTYLKGQPYKQRFPDFVQDRIDETKVSFSLIQAVLAGPPEFLTPEQEQWLFRELQRRKAFEQSRRHGVVDDWEIWRNHREQGFAFDAQLDLQLEYDIEELDDLPENVSWLAYSY